MYKYPAKPGRKPEIRIFRFFFDMATLLGAHASTPVRVYTQSFYFILRVEMFSNVTDVIAVNRRIQ